MSEEQEVYEAGGGPSEKLDEVRFNKIAAIAFSALIKAYGKPLFVSKAEVDALPDHFTLTCEVGEQGRLWRVEETDATENASEICGSEGKSKRQGIPFRCDLPKGHEGDHSGNGWVWRQ